VPRFYYDVWDGGWITHDEVGLELESLEAAEDEAIRGIAGISYDSLWWNRASDILVEVRDEHGQQVLAVAVSMTVRRTDLAPARGVQRPH
jgi:hypothetical protein